MDTEQRKSPEELQALHRRSMNEAQQLETSVMVTERNWNAMLKMQHDLFQQQMQLDIDLKMLLTKQEAQEALTEMQMSAENFEKQAGSLNERYSSICKELTESTKTALSTMMREMNQQLSNMAQAETKKIRLCAWVSITAVILCTALCALAVLWSR